MDSEHRAGTTARGRARVYVGLYGKWYWLIRLLLIVIWFAGPMWLEFPLLLLLLLVLMPLARRRTYQAGKDAALGDLEEQARRFNAH